MRKSRSRRRKDGGRLGDGSFEEVRIRSVG